MARKAKPESTPKLRKIHIDLPVEIHKKLRIKAALEDKSMQALVVQVITEAVNDVVIPKTGKSRKKR
jgi:predicted HicB family RNase H-like nuclease